MRFFKENNEIVIYFLKLSKKDLLMIKNNIKNTKLKIENNIINHNRVKIFFLDDFAVLGTPETIKKSLQRLTNSGLLERLANGIYWYPKKD